MAPTLYAHMKKKTRKKNKRKEEKKKAARKLENQTKPNQNYSLWALKKEKTSILKACFYFQ
jgi:hypothetical protein